MAAWTGVRRVAGGSWEVDQVHRLMGMGSSIRQKRSIACGGNDFFPIVFLRFLAGQRRGWLAGAGVADYSHH